MYVSGLNELFNADTYFVDVNDFETYQYSTP